MKKWLILLLLIFFLPLVTAITLGTYKQDACVILKQTCSTCTYNNITSILYPNSSNALIVPVSMSRDGTEYSYLFCSTLDIGRYVVCGVGDLDSTHPVWCYDFYINKTGMVNDVNETYFFIFLGLILFLLILASVYQMSQTTDYGWAVGYLSGAYILFIILSFITYQISLYYINTVTIITNFMYMIWWLSMIAFLPYLFGVGIYLLSKAAEEKEVSKYIDMGYSRDEVSKLRKRR